MTLFCSINIIDNYLITFVTNGVEFIFIYFFEKNSLAHTLPINHFAFFWVL